MREISKKIEGWEGWGVALFIATGLLLTNKEVGTMKVAVLVILVALGLVIPLFWLGGSLTSMVYFAMQKLGILRKEEKVTFHPVLGVTMADGGEAIEEEKKKK